MWASSWSPRSVARRRFSELFPFPPFNRPRKRNLVEKIRTFSMGVEGSAPGSGRRGPRYATDGQDDGTCKEIPSPTLGRATTTCCDSADFAAKTDDLVPG